MSGVLSMRRALEPVRRTSSARRPRQLVEDVRMNVQRTHEPRPSVPERRREPKGPAPQQIEFSAPTDSRMTGQRLFEQAGSRAGHPDDQDDVLGTLPGPGRSRDDVRIVRVQQRVDPACMRIRVPVPPHEAIALVVGRIGCGMLSEVVEHVPGREGQQGTAGRCEARGVQGRKGVRRTPLRETDLGP